MKQDSFNWIGFLMTQYQYTTPIPTIFSKDSWLENQKDRYEFEFNIIGFSFDYIFPLSEGFMILELDFLSELWNFYIVDICWVEDECNKPPHSFFPLLGFSAWTTTWDKCEKITWNYCFVGHPSNSTSLTWNSFYKNLYN